MNARKLLFPLVATCLLTLPDLARATPPEGEAGGEAEAGGSVSLGGDTEAGGDAAVETDAGGDTEAAAEPAAEGPKPKKATKYSQRKDQKWIKRWAPEKNMVELGVYGGVLLLAETHELFGADRDLPDQGYKPLRSLNPDLGARVGYYPIKFFGVEAEGGVMPSKLRDASGNAMLYTFRAHAVAQLGLWSVTPFVLVGAGGWGVSSPRDSLGKDLDPALHFGGGVKIFINRWVMLRLDVRDIISHQQSVDATFKSHNLEALLGLSITLGREKDKDTRIDSDGDGFYDDEDTCVNEPGVAPDGCPIRDADGDGILDPDDQCVDVAETFNEFNDSDGCPESDRDGDGFWDDDGTGSSQDTCPDEAGVAPDGCPIPDTDGDTILDPDDDCIPDPETKNGYQDTDGCPDEVPRALAKFTGAIKGITFDTDKDVIRKSSQPILDNAVEVLTEFKDIRIEVAGHTDDTGDRDHNIDLSKRRAEAVRKYLVDKGIDASRIEANGYGPDKPADPVAETDSKAVKKTKRSNNRRIEFKILTAN
ncbi:OmpA family protein [Nannocystaceae bacterium ST9]